MRLSVRIILFAALSFAFCDTATFAVCASSPFDSLSPEERVVRGLSTPGEIILSAPDVAPPIAFLLSAFFTIKLPGLDPNHLPEQIGDRLYVLYTKPSQSRKQTNENFETARRYLAVVREIRRDPAGFHIPLPLRPFITASDLANILDFGLQGVVAAPARDDWATLATMNWSEFDSRDSPFVYVFGTPGDAEVSRQCGLRAIHAEKTWHTGPYATNVNVAIVDSGLTDKHVDLHPYASPATATDVDLNGHGTHVAGIVGALKDDAIGIVGTTWQTNITAYAFLDRYGRGTIAQGVKKINDAVAAGAQVVLLAWGTGVDSPDLRKAITDATDKALFVTAAGNDRIDICKSPVYPAAYDFENVITVMATNCDDLVVRFSNYSKERVDLAAPGEGPSKNQRIYSTVLNQGWGNLAGTSMSAAFVAGAAALVFEQSTATTLYSPKQVKCWLERSVDVLPMLANLNATAGRLDLECAVQPLDVNQCKK